MTGPGATIEEIAAELYAVPPAQFTASRDARARQLRAGGARDVAAAVAKLRRPAVSAWLVDALVRRRPAELAALLELGERMREATAVADPGLRELAEQRRDAVGALLAAAREVGDEAGLDVSAAVEREVTATLEAATAAPDAARAVASGRLVRPIAYAGFGEIPLGDVVALPGRLPPSVPSRAGPPAGGRRAAARRPPAPTRSELSKAQRQARAAADAADDAQRSYEQRRADAQRAAAAADEAARELAALRQRLAAAETSLVAAREAARATTRSAREAERAARSAHAAADAARQRLARLTGGG